MIGQYLQLSLRIPSRFSVRATNPTPANKGRVLLRIAPVVRQRVALFAKPANGVVGLVSQFTHGLFTIAVNPLSDGLYD